MSDMLSYQDFATPDGWQRYKFQRESMKEENELLRNKVIPKERELRFLKGFAVFYFVVRFVILLIMSEVMS